MTTYGFHHIFFLIHIIILTDQVILVAGSWSDIEIFDLDGGSIKCPNFGLPIISKGTLSSFDGHPMLCGGVTVDGVVM